MSIKEGVNYIRGIFNDVSRRNLNNRARQIEDHLFYDAINNGQWSPSAVQTMLEQGRVITTFNFIKKQIETDGGMLLQNPFEFNFDTEIGQNPEDALLMNELRFRDKDLGRWAAENALFTLDGLINTGVMEIFIDNQKDKLGAINFRRRIPTDFHFAPDWRTEDIMDNRQIFQTGYLDPIRILEDWGTTSENREQIKQAIKTWREQRNSIKTERKTEKVILNSEFSLQEEINGQFLVLQMHELQDIKVNKLFNRSNGQFLKETLEDTEDKNEMFQLLSMREGAELTELPVNQKKLIVRTIAPGLSQEFFLADGPDSRQIGNYPFTVFSAYNQNGNRYGRVNQLKDPQSVYNKNKAIKMNWQQVSPYANKLYTPDTFFDDDEEERYIATRQKGGGNFKMNNVDLIKNDERGIPPTDLDTDADSAFNFADRIGSPLSAQAQARPGTSGVLFNAEREQAAVSLELINQKLQKAENDKGEMYIDLALNHYGDDIARSFKSIETKEDVFINTDERNRIQNMSRLSVRITQAPVGASIKRENLQILINLKQAATTPLQQATLNALSIPLIPGLDEENKKAVEKDAQLDLEFARKQVEFQKAQMDAQMQQLTGGQGLPPSSETSPVQGNVSPELQQLVSEFAGETAQPGQEQQSIGLIP